MHTGRRICQLMLIAELAAVPVWARAQGFGLNEIGSCAVARGFATTGAPCHDASVLYWNPGAATTLPGVSVYLGGAAIAGGGSFTADTTQHVYDAAVPTVVAPHLFINYTGSLGGRRAAAGFGVYVPYGLTSQWNTDFPGRFDALKAHVQTIYLQPTVAIDVIPDQLSVGGGPVIGTSTVELKQSLDLSTVVVLPGVTFGQLGIPRETEFGRADLKGSATAVGWTAGVHYKPLPMLQFGARILSALSFNYNGATARFTQVPTGLILPATNPITGVPTPVDQLVASQFGTGVALTTQKVATQITHPLQAQVGVGYSPRLGSLLSLDYELVQWSRFKTLPVTFMGAGAAALSHTLLEDYKDSYAIRAGLEQLFWPGGPTARLGFSYAEAPAPPVTVTPLLPDMNRYNGSLGAGIPLGEIFALDAAYLHVFTDGRRGRIVTRTTAQAALTAAELNSGFYTLHANVVSVSLKARF